MHRCCEPGGEGHPYLEAATEDGRQRAGIDPATRAFADFKRVLRRPNASNGLQQVVFPEEPFQPGFSPFSGVALRAIGIAEAISDAAERSIDQSDAPALTGFGVKAEDGAML